jgi:chromosome partitioning protein
VGKSTLAINLACRRATRDDGRILVVDGDDQQTSLMALTQRALDEQEPHVTVVSFTTEDSMRTQMPGIALNYTDTIIDAGGRDTGPFRAAALYAHQVLIPFAPSSFDVWAFSQTNKILEEVRVIRPDLKAFAVLNQANPVSKQDMLEAREALAEFPNIEYLETPIMKRASVGRAAAEGLCVHEYSKKDPLAEAELDALVDALWPETAGMNI